jgi:hypothetical protein
VREFFPLTKAEQPGRVVEREARGSGRRVRGGFLLDSPFYLQTAGGPGDHREPRPGTPLTLCPSGSPGPCRRVRTGACGPGAGSRAAGEEGRRCGSGTVAARHDFIVSVVSHAFSH